VSSPLRGASPIQRAALAILPNVRLELDLMRADADAAARLRDAAGRSADAQRDAAERAARLKAEASGAERIVGLLGKLARG
jgi:hypothetical protein